MKDLKAYYQLAMSLRSKNAEYPHLVSLEHFSSEFLDELCSFWLLNHYPDTGEPVTPKIDIKAFDAIALALIAAKESNVYGMTRALYFSRQYVLKDMEST